MNSHERISILIRIATPKEIKSRMLPKKGKMDLNLQNRLGMMGTKVCCGVQCRRAAPVLGVLKRSRIRLSGNIALFRVFVSQYPPNSFYLLISVNYYLLFFAVLEFGTFLFILVGSMSSVFIKIIIKQISESCLLRILA